MFSVGLLQLCVLFATSIASTSSMKEELLGDIVELYAYCDPTPNSEIHRSNGLYYIKPFAYGPVIPVICSNGWTMIDPSLDPQLNAIPSYLSSWDYSRLSTDYIITNLDDTSSFRDWWLPSTPSTKFRVANQCQSCEAATDPALSDNVAYYTDGSNFCYTWFLDGNPCAQHINEFACNVCDAGELAEDHTGEYWQTCSALQMPADSESWHAPDMRVNWHLIYRPVMSLQRQACSCYQPSTSRVPLKYTIHRTQIPKVPLRFSWDGVDIRSVVDYVDPSVAFDVDDADGADEDAVACEHNIHYLSQQDFLYGTYRIRECGEYIFTEDVLCDFNAPSADEERSDEFSPNSIIDDRLFWFPTEQQAAEYPGLLSYEGSYSLGFFAGMTIESDNVIINLNGFQFSMDKRFYLQQRFFSLIEMGAKPFLPHQGASAWGLTEQFFPQNVEIKGPGELGLSSHHGIHGNEVLHAHIHDLSIAHFDVAGIGCNGCQHVTMENLVVGPQNDNIPTLGRYTHSRAFIPRLKDLNDRHGDKEIQFYGREKTTVSALCARMVQQMDMIYFHSIDGVNYDAYDTEWTAAAKLYKNPTGWMDGGSSYGISINGQGAAVVGIGTRTGNVNNITVSNVEIFGIFNQAQEKIKFTVQGGTSRGILFDVTDWLAVVDQIEDRDQTQYVGDVFTDIQFAANKFMDSWYYRNSLYIDPVEESFVFDGNREQNGYPFMTIFPPLDPDQVMSGCGTDIQLHSPKGAIGLMVNGAQDSLFNNLYIHDVYNWAALGLEVCGPYRGPHLSTEDSDISYGYTGTRAHGMVIDFTSGDYKDIRIENVESWHGEANGLTIYKESHINLQSILVRNVNAGTKLDRKYVERMTLPNLVPRACAVDIHAETSVHFVNGEMVENVRFESVDGFDMCDQYVLNNDVDSLQPAKQTQSGSHVYVQIGVALFAMLFVLFVGLCMYCILDQRKKAARAEFSEFTPLLETDLET